MAPTTPDRKKLYERFAPGVAVPPPPEAALMDLPPPVSDLPALDEAGLEALKRQLASEPSFTLDRVRQLFDAEITEEQLRELVTYVDAAFTDPDVIVAHDAALEVALGKTSLPDDFRFPGMNLARIPIDPAICRFETVRDALGWALNTGHYWLRSVVHQPKARFRWAEASPSLFHYDLKVEGGKSSVALFSDFGTGYYHSRYIAQHINAAKPHHVVHLGDVYYAGKQDEFENRFTTVLADLVAQRELFTLNANHEMFSRGAPYFRYLDARRGELPGVHRQEGSYFCLSADRFRIIGIDTAYHASNRHAEAGLVYWLKHALVEGKNRGQTNILLSSDHAYDLGKSSSEQLLRDVLGSLPPDAVDLWFWGNVHYAAFFDRGPGAPFIGSCIGHAGYPYTRRKEEKTAAAPVLWVETEARFPSWTEVRQDRGNAGFVLMDLDHATQRIQLRYLDWTQSERLTVQLAPSNGELRVVDLREHPRNPCRV